MGPDAVIKASAPGSLMLLGEHAVLYGHKALAAAVDKRLAVRLTPRTDRQVRICSALGECEGSLDQLPEHPRLGFVLDAIARQAGTFSTGFDLRIKAGFSHTVGLGSSAAVSVAVIAALRFFRDASLDRGAVFADALTTLHAVQGRGSGTDLAASVYGGLISYRCQPCQVMPLPGLPPIGLYYAGYKTPTAEVIARVQGQQPYLPALYPELYRLMHRTCEEAEQAVRLQDWPQLGRCLNFYQGLMDALGVCDRALADIIYQLREHPAVLGAKISGSGLGDCVLSLGETAPELDAYERIPVQLSPEGVSVGYE